MQDLNNCRKRKRKPTMTPRFGSSTLALEIGLLRMTMDVMREFESKEQKKKEK